MKYAWRIYAISPFAVALFTRAWIEIHSFICLKSFVKVALFTRAWIEMQIVVVYDNAVIGRPLHEGVD